MTRPSVEQPFHTDLDYYEGRADGIATTSGVGVDEARAELARRHGFAGWDELAAHVARMASGEEPPTPFVLAYRAVEAGDRAALEALLDAHPDLVRQRGTNGNDLLGMAGDLDLVRLLLERGADPNRGNDYGWTKLHQAGYSNDRGLAQLMLDAGGRTDVSARGDGGTPLVAALFWGHREVVDLLGLEPGNLRVAAGLGRLDLIRELAGTPAAGAHRGFYRPHGGFPAWEPTRRPAGGARRGARLGGEGRPGRGDRAARRAGRARGRGSVSRHAARVGGGERARGRDPQRSSSSAPTRTSAARSAGRTTARA